MSTFAFSSSLNHTHAAPNCARPLTHTHTDPHSLCTPTHPTSQCTHSPYTSLCMPTLAYRSHAPTTSTHSVSGPLLVADKALSVPTGCCPSKQQHCRGGNIPSADPEILLGKSGTPLPPLLPSAVTAGAEAGHAPAGIPIALTGPCSAVEYVAVPSALWVGGLPRASHGSGHRV